ncbi:MAG: hypothetical protein K6F40_10465 [Bacteroidales bacterium]|nr:hypothetical protein [Bacteroidales bacterium]
MKKSVFLPPISKDIQQFENQTKTQYAQITFTIHAASRHCDAVGSESTNGSNYW